MNGTRKCTVESCTRKHYARGWCRNHYNTGMRALTPETGVRGCDFSGCQEAHYGRGYCRRHWERFSKHGDPEVRLILHGASVAERLMTYSERVGDCIEWTGRISWAGYGQIEVRRRNIGTHRASYEEFKGQIPDGLVVRHKCDNRRCINPEHLELGTHLDNVSDMVTRGRSLSGTRNPAAKLNEQKAREIRELVRAGRTYREVAVRYGVGESTVSRVMRGTVWAEK